MQTHVQMQQKRAAAQRRAAPTPQMVLLAAAVAAAALAPGCRFGAPRRSVSGAGGARGADGFVPLVTEETFDDVFVQVLDSPWIFEDGVISSRQNPDGRRQGESWLLTRRFYRDFVLRLEFRITPGGNSGVFVRVPVSWQERLAAPYGGPVPWEAGYEVNINNDEPNYPTGSIWALAKGPKKLQREGEWNRLEVRVEGNRIWTWVNGTPAIAGFQLPPRPGADRGAIGFQRHGTPAYRDKLIELRRIEIRELP